MQGETVKNPYTIVFQPADSRHLDISYI